jgi:hypothetical protein
MITIDASRYVANGSHVGSCPARHRPDFSILDVNAQGLRATPDGAVSRRAASWDGIRARQVNAGTGGALGHRDRGRTRVQRNKLILNGVSAFNRNRSHRVSPRSRMNARVTLYASAPSAGVLGIFLWSLTAGSVPGSRRFDRRGGSDLPGARTRCR